MSRSTRWTLVLFCLAVALVAPVVVAQDVDIFVQANQEYKKGEYAASLEGYRKLAGKVHNPGLYLNLGNAAYKTGHLGWAIVYYERGLRLSPRNSDLVTNLRYVRDKLVDRSGDEAASFVTTAYRTLSLTELLVVTSFLWLVTLAATAALFVARVSIAGSISALFSFFEVPKGHKLAALFVPAVCALLLFVGWTGTRVHDETIPRAIVLDKEVKATSGPGADATVVFAIHEGTKVTVLRRSDRWAQISLANGYSGWVPETAVEEI